MGSGHWSDVPGRVPPSLEGQRRATLPTVKARMNPSLPMEGSGEMKRREWLFREGGAGGWAAPSQEPPLCLAVLTTALFSHAISARSFAMTPQRGPDAQSPLPFSLFT